MCNLTRCCAQKCGTTTPTSTILVFGSRGGVMYVGSVKQRTSGKGGFGSIQPSTPHKLAAVPPHHHHHTLHASFRLLAFSQPINEYRQVDFSTFGSTQLSTPHTLAAVPPCTLPCTTRLRSYPMNGSRHVQQITGNITFNPCDDRRCKKKKQVQHENQGNIRKTNHQRGDLHAPG